MLGRYDSVIKIYGNLTPEEINIQDWMVDFGIGLFEDAPNGQKYFGEWISYRCKSWG